MLPPLEPGMPAIRWLYTSLRAGILDCRLRPGMRLPATRDLARHYGVSRGTVVSAFQQLKSEGYLQANVGSGTYVTTVLPDRLLEVAARTHAGRLVPTPQPHRVSDFARRVTATRSVQLGPVRAFRLNQPALDLFPTALWAQITARRIRRASRDLLVGCEPMGYPPLQEAVADYLTTSRGVNCGRDQIAIVSGVQDALDMVARLLVNPGDTVAVEDPGYLGAMRAFQAQGATIASVLVDEEGMSVDDRALDDARLIYVTPAHQFPLGVSMSLARRLALLERARRSRALIFEDDYDSEYRYHGRPLPALQGLDTYGQVIFAGSFSKVLFPSLRLGYLVVPTDLVDSFAAILSITKRHAPVLEQAVLADFISSGHFGRHIRRMREVYAERLDVLLESGRERLHGLLDISVIEAGLQTIGWLPDSIAAESVVSAAASRDVEVSLLSRCTSDSRAMNALQLGFAAVEPREIRRGVRELAQVLEEHQGQ
jgi:GntR family transcriptional regulator/MocR family aminotransferase